MPKFSTQTVEHISYPECTRMKHTQPFQIRPHTALTE